MSAPEMTKLEPPESWRIYNYPDGQIVKVEGPITHLAVSASGNHRLKTPTQLHIVAPGWRHIIAGAKEFTL